MKSKDREGDAARRNVRMWGVFLKNGKLTDVFTRRSYAYLWGCDVRPVTVSWEEKKVK